MATPHLPSMFAACANERYAPGLEILIAGMANLIASEQKWVFHVIDCELHAETRERIRQRVGCFKNGRIAFIDPPLDRFKSIQTRRYHISAYYRMGLPEILNAQRVIYLDSDVLPLSEIHSFISSIHDSTMPVAAVADFETHSLAEDSEEISKLFGNDTTGHYFNSGVMGLDLDQLREEDFTAKACDLLTRLGDHARFPDQSAFNALFAGRWNELESKWNTPAWVFDQQADNQIHGILHYTNSAPWLQRHYRPSQALFERAAMELGVTLPKPEKDLWRTIPTALTKWLVAPARVAWHGLKAFRALRKAENKTATGERHIMLHWLCYFTGGPARVLRYRRRIREIRDPAFQIFPYRP